MRAMEELIRTGLAELGINAPKEAPQLLARYGQALMEKNQVMNLTAITEPSDVATLHMLDCAALLNCVGLGGKTLIDVGTGAGFPGVPLKILTPALDVTLLDSLNKRVDWLSEVSGELSLTGIQAVQGRAEEMGRNPEFREQFDFATARAVAELRLLCELCLPFVKVGGRFLAMKGVYCGSELVVALPDIQSLWGRVDRCFDYTIPHTGVAHRVVIVEKTAQTPEQYPRRWAKLQKHPL